MQELWEMRGTPSWTFIPGPVWLRVVELGKGQIELFDIETVYKQMSNTKLNC